MKKILLGILVCTLLIATAFSVNGCVESNDIKSNISIDKGIASSSTTADYKSFFNRPKEGESNILNKNGNWQWAKGAGGTDYDVGAAITTLSDDSTIVIGSFSGSATFGKGESCETVLVSDGSTDIFVARYNPDGTIAWAKRAGGTSGDAGQGIVTLSDDSTIVIGSFSGSATFGKGEPAETVLVSDGSTDIFVAHYYTDGTIMWAKRAGGTDYDVGAAITTLSDDSTIVIGSFSGIADFGPYNLTSQGDNDVFVAKLGNQPPSTPTIYGPTSGKAGTAYDYDFTATDPDGNDVKYYIDWGDDSTEWTSFAASGTPVTVSHTWDEQGDYTITAKAQDTGGLTGPEATLPISMPKARFVHNSLFLRLLEQFPNAFPILRQLRGL